MLMLPICSYDVDHVVLDNLQFMLAGQCQCLLCLGLNAEPAWLVAARGYDKFDVQDNAINMLRQFATQNNVHITLVIHPRKASLQPLSFCDDSSLRTRAGAGQHGAGHELDLRLGQGDAGSRQRAHHPERRCH